MTRRAEPVRLGSLAPPVPLAAVLELQDGLRRRHPAAEVHLELGEGGAVVVLATLRPTALRESPLAAGVTGIVDAVAEVFDVAAGDILGLGRQQHVVAARQAAWVLCRALTDLSLPALARAFGRQDHTTVSHGVRVGAKRVATSEQYRRSVERAREHYLRRSSCLPGLEAPVEPARRRLRSVEAGA